MAVILDFGLARDFSHTYARDMRAKIVTHPLYKANPLANEPMNSTSTDVLTICMLKIATMAKTKFHKNACCNKCPRVIKCHRVKYLSGGCNKRQTAKIT